MTKTAAPLIITICSNRKSVQASISLMARTQAHGTSDQLAEGWSKELKKAESVKPASELYGGRGFQEAKRASLILEGRLAIVSAGLGLVFGEAMVPAYSLTLARGNADSILRKTGGTSGDWWSAIERFSPFHVSPFREEVLILAALSQPYLEMVSDAWAAWPAARLRKLRLFTKQPPTHRLLTPAWMPYDDRLDAVGLDLAGTQGDFAQRALRHFAQSIATKQGNAAQHATAVSRALKGYKRRSIVKRERRTDDEIVALIRKSWRKTDGRSAAMLRLLRDDLAIACEQRRFQDLFKLAASQLRAAA